MRNSTSTRSPRISPRKKRKPRAKKVENKNYFKRKSEDIAARFEKFKNSARNKLVVPQKYKNYLRNVNVSRPQLKVLALLPVIVLSMLVIVSKNKHALKPFTDTVKKYLEASNQEAFTDDSFKVKIFKLITILGTVLVSLDPLTLIYMGLSVLNIIFYEMPGILERLDKTPDVPMITIVRDIVRTLIEIKPTIFEMPRRF
ncbi:MAG: hypothetical protein EHM20_16255 [Alphaproteobacteria bacterium]|nr:MAG: hypothetical protein EHM20_16255 [Alphaproteobacteria bacterium]